MSAATTDLGKRGARGAQDPKRGPARSTARPSTRPRTINDGRWACAQGRGRGVETLSRECAGRRQGRLEVSPRELISLGAVGGTSATDATVATALTAAGCDFVERLPAGVDTPLGQSRPEGVDLSGGQWQRLMVARAFAEPTHGLLVLDEPSASLDPFAEHQLLDAYALRARQEDLTLVVVTHRYATVQFADMIVVMDEGRIAEVGSHTELLGADGHYAAAYREQQEAHA